MEYYIMNAKCLFEDDKTDIAGVISVWGDKDQTILVCNRTIGATTSKIFVSGSGVGYIPKGTELPVRATYIETNGGMRADRTHYMGLEIVNVIELDKKGVLQPRNMEGLNEKRWAWTMK